MKKQDLSQAGLFGEPARETAPTGMDAVTDPVRRVTPPAPEPSFIQGFVGVDDPEFVPGSYACISCGKHRFHKPNTTCYWCQKRLLDGRDSRP